MLITCVECRATFSDAAPDSPILYVGDLEWAEVDFVGEREAKEGEDA